MAVNADPPLTTLPSAFLQIPDSVPASSSAPSIVHLKRDLLLPVALGQPSPDAVLNTRFGDFSHHQMTSKPYGSQIRATSSNDRNSRKRKRKEDSTEPANVGSGDAASGFVHVLAPTAELWTTSLPHRTQVVYTPDSSYILHRLGVKPGTVILEAGAGSGSFSHAAVRAVYSGYPDGREMEGPSDEKEERRLGKVWSFEFHKERVERLKEEIDAHGLDGLVGVVHRDVCKDGFLVPQQHKESKDDTEHESPRATAVFLDLPAPWLALPHLTRAGARIKTPATPSTEAATSALSADPTATLTATIPLQSLLDPSSSSDAQISIRTEDGASVPLLTPEAKTPSTPAPEAPHLPSPLDPHQTVHICTFSPCIEQVNRTVSTLRKLGWIDIDMVEIQHQRVEVRRQTQKGYDEGAGPRTISEALSRLRKVSEYREKRREVQLKEHAGEDTDLPPFEKLRTPRPEGGKRKNKDPEEGRIITRLEPEIKTHTSYLTFATLPREWSEEEEQLAKMEVKKISKGTDAGLVGEKEKKWKQPDGEPRVSKRAAKRAQREQRKRAQGEGRDGDGQEESPAVAKEEESVDAMDVDTI